MEKHNLICINCPMGCRLEIIETKKGGWLIEGNQCKRGINYAQKELTAPTRTLTTTVKVEVSQLRRLPVKSKEGLPKEKIFDAMNLINQTSVKPPILVGDVIIENILDTGIDIIATRDL
jgi:CxxC motif-containing protein